MSKIDYYEVLGVSKNATDLDIKRAYKRLAIKYHPDRNKGNKSYDEKFKEIKLAYEVLSNNEKRSMYDKYGHSAFDPNSSTMDSSSFSADFSSNGDFSDIFGDVFGDIFGTKKKNNTSVNVGSDITYNMELDLEEVIKVVFKEVKINVTQKCSVCYGSGSRSGFSKQVCSSCKGKGNIYIRQGFFSIQQTCPKCNGSCYVIDNPCYICRGSGTERSLSKFSVKIPSGVNNGDNIRISGKGNCGDYGVNPGDLYIKIKVRKHSIFTRENNNLYCEIPINFTMAALGGEIEVPTLDNKVKLKIPSETQTGRLFRIKNKGIKSLKSNIYGDLLCRVLVETPINLNDYQKKLLRDLGFSLTGEYFNYRNHPKSKSFFERVRRFFDNLTK